VANPFPFLVSTLHAWPNRALEHLLVLLLVGALAGLIGERLVNRGMPGGLIGAIVASLVARGVHSGGAGIATDTVDATCVGSARRRRSYPHNPFPTSVVREY